MYLDLAAPFCKEDPRTESSNEYLEDAGFLLHRGLPSQPGSCELRFQIPSAVPTASPPKMVLPTGFEPVIFHVRGGCPGPLDDGSMNEEKEVVGEVGFEPTSV